MELYKRFIKFHDNDNVPCESKLKITTRNNYVEYTQCNPDDQREFNPKPGVQTELYNLWKKWHNGETFITHEKGNSAESWIKNNELEWFNHVRLS